MTARRIAWGIWGVTVALVAVWPVLGAASSGLEEELVFYVVVPLAVLANATVGALITSRHPDNVIGLILSGTALSFAIAVTASDYATVSTEATEPLALTPWVAWLGRITTALWLAPVPMLFLLFPNGRVASPRWRPVLWVLLGALGVNLVLFALTPGRLEMAFGEPALRIPNPIRLLPSSWREPVEDVTELAGLVAVLCAALAIISLVLRFRRAAGIERQQIRWLGYVGGILVAIPVVALALAGARELAGVDVDADGDVIGIVAWVSFFSVLLFGVPIACGIAILRYRLYELDVVVKKTVQYGLLLVASLVVIGLLVVIPGVLFVGIDRRVAPGIVTGVILAAVVWLLRVPARRIANRVVYGGRATPYEVLSEFAERIGETYSTEDVLPRMAQLLGEATGARAAKVWLLVGRVMRAEASWPDGASASAEVPVTGDAAPTVDGDRVFEVRHRGELLGALSVTEAPDDPMTPAKEKLVRDMAAQAGLVLRNVRLIEDLRDSRRRIVAAQDERARALERNIHDGAQQQLVALSVKLRLAQGLVDRDPAQATTLLDDLQRQTTDTLEDLRDLARGIYPPVLADRGLAAALEAQVRRSPLAVELHPDGVDRYTREVEAAIYFTCLEALNNVAKYARATSVQIRLWRADGAVGFAVIDDGEGFDPVTTPRGSGLQGMVDRVEAVGGQVEIRSRPGAGTEVVGSVPVG